MGKLLDSNASSSSKFLKPEKLHSLIPTKCTVYCHCLPLSSRFEAKICKVNGLNLDKINMLINPERLQIYDFHDFD